jgi:hypothetical protein
MGTGMSVHARVSGMETFLQACQTSQCTGPALPARTCEGRNTALVKHFTTASPSVTLTHSQIHTCTHALARKYTQTYLLVQRLDAISVILVLPLQFHDLLVLLVHGFAKLRQLYFALCVCFHACVHLSCCVLHAYRHAVPLGPLSVYPSRHLSSKTSL